MHREIFQEWFAQVSGSDLYTLSEDRELSSEH